MNDELEEGEVAIESLETDVQDELKTHKEKKKVKKSKNKPTPNKTGSPEDPFTSNPNPYERIEKKIKVEGKPYPRKSKNEFTTSTYKTKPCEFYRKGSCQKGDDCTFSHDIAVGLPDVVCKFYVTGNCQKGDSCPFSHDLKKYPCKYFWGAGNCSQGINCKFSHEPLHDKQKAMDFIEENEQHFMNMYNSMGKTNLGNLFLEYLQRKADQNKDTKAQHLLLPPTQDQNSSFMPPPPQQQNQFNMPPQMNYPQPQQNMPPANLQPRQYQNPNPNPYDRPPQNQQQQQQQQQQMYPGPGLGPGPGRQQYNDPNMAQKQNFMPPPPNQNFQNPQFQPPNQYMPQSSQPPQHMQQQQQHYQPQQNLQYPPQNQFGPSGPSGPQNQMNNPQNLGYPQNQNIHGPPQMQMQRHHYQPQPQHQPQHHQFVPQQQQQQQPHHYQPHPSQHQQHPQHHHYQPQPQHHPQQQHQHHHFVPQQQGPAHNQYPGGGGGGGGGGDPRFSRQSYEENRMGGGGQHNVYGPPSRMENTPYNNPPHHYQKPIQQDNYQPQGQGGPMMHPNQPLNEPWRRQPQAQPQGLINQFPNQPQPQLQPQSDNKQYGGGGMQQILPPAQNTAVFLGPPRDGSSVNTFTPGLSNQQQGLLMVPEEIKSDKSPTGNIYIPANKDPRFEAQKRSEEKPGPGLGAGPLPNQYFSKDAKPPAEIKPTREKEPPKKTPEEPIKEIFPPQEKPAEEPKKAQITSEAADSEQPAKSSFWSVVKSRQLTTKTGRKGAKSPPKEERKPVLMQYSPEPPAKTQEKPKDPNEEKYFNKAKILEKLGLTQKTTKKAELNYDLDKLFSTFEFHNTEKGFPPAKIPKEVAISNIKDTLNSLKELLVSNE